MVILGAGPTGLGAAQRLAELGDVDVRLFDENDRPGGLAASFTDGQGFTWDIGGHVLFSHYGYFDRLMDRLLGDQWLYHEREAWVWMRERFVPYPLQNNIHLLPRDEFLACFRDLLAAQRGAAGVIRHFGDWVERSFGNSLADTFMRPYNAKVWAYPLSELSHQWVGERVATVDLMRVVANTLDGSHDASWGPNNRFRFPVSGGTGRIWTTLANTLPDGVFRPNRRCTRIETSKRLVHFDDGSHERYDVLISTIPLDECIRMSDLSGLYPAAEQLRYSTTHVVGVGMKGTPPPHLKTKCWMYFPEANCPFYRATVFSNYSPNNVPDSTKYWSLMTEVAESAAKPVEAGRLTESVIAGLLATRLLQSPDEVTHTWVRTAAHGYPTPFVGRDGLVHPILAELDAKGVYSRGRFGGWKYEVSNQDHSLMQGVELANYLMFGTPEQTYWFPALVNGRKS